MKSIFRFLALWAVLIVAPQAANAANLPGGTIAITNVILEGDRIFIIGPGFTNPEGCQNKDAIVLAATPEMRDRYLSVAMTALASGLKIDLWVQSCVATNWGTAAVGYYMNLHR